MNLYIYGDSNPFGVRPDTSSLYDYNDRYVGILESALKEKYGNKMRMVCNTLPGRSLKSINAVAGITSGVSEFQGKFLEDAKEVEKANPDNKNVFLLTLCINDLLANTPENTVIEYLKQYIDEISQRQFKNLSIYILVPPPLGECKSKSWMPFVQPCKEISIKFIEKLKMTAKDWKSRKIITDYIDLKDAKTGKDGLHFTKQAHKVIASLLIEHF